MFHRLINKMPVIGNFVRERPTLQRIIDNIGWLTFDRVFRLGVGLFVMGWVARYLGPEQFGIWNYAIAFTSLFSAFATLGLDGIVVRELVNHPEKTEELLGTAFILRLIGGFIAFILSIGGAFLLGNTDTLTLSLIALSAGGFVFQAFMVIDYYNQAKIMSKYTVWAQNGAFLIMSVVKVILLIVKAPLLAFALAGLAEIILGSVFLTFFFFGSYSFSFKILNFNFELAKSLLKDSWPLMLSGIAVMIYMRIDQVMIKEMLGDREVGLYSAAVRISEIWYFIPMAIASSVFPKILEYKKASEELYYKRLQELFYYMTWLSIAIVIFIMLSGKIVIETLFGADYIESYNVLVIHAWSGIFVSLGVASSGWYLAEGLVNMSFYRTALGCVVNIIFNLILIPKFLIIGAAISTLIGYASAGYLFDAFSHKTKKIFLLKTKSFLPINIWSR
ncbi:MAG: flippase [Geminocystis sp.]|nr:flippase [Geminocystis sp.]